jgi:hydrophobe/amphiphile efflux-3 (HAE3) family protein
MRIYEYIARVVQDHPWTIIIVSLLLTVGLGVGLLFIQGQLSYVSLLPKGFPSVKALEDLNKDFDGISYEQVLIRAPDVIDSRITEFLVLLETYFNKDPRFNKGQLQYEADRNGRPVLDVLGKPVPIIQDYLTPFIAGAKTEIAARSPIKDLSYATNANLKAVTGLDYEQTVRGQYLSVPQVRDQMIGKQKFLTPDYKATEVMIKVGANLTDTKQAKLGNDLENLFKSKLSAVPGVKIDISGDPTLARDFDRHIKNKTILLFVLSIIFVILTLFLAFRRTTDTMIPIAVMMMSLVWTFGLLGYLRIPYSVASVAIMPLLLGHALTFIVPFIARYYEEAEHLLGSVAAVGRSLRTVGMALFPAAATSIVGFLVFEFSVLPPLRDFGVASAVGTAFIFVLSLTLLPAIMVVRDRRLEEPAPTGEREKFRTHFDGFTRRQEQSLFARGTDRALRWCSDLSTKHSLSVIIVSAVLIVGALLGSFGLTTDSDLRKLVPRDLPSIHTDYQIEKAFGPDQTDVIMVNGDVLAPKSIQVMADLEKAIYEDKANTFYTYNKKLHRNVKNHHYDKVAIIGLSDVVVGANNGKLPTTRAEVKNALKVAADNGGYVGGVLSSDNKHALVSLNGLAAQTAEQVHTKLAILRDNSAKILTPAGLKFELGGITPITNDMTKNIIPTETWSSILSLILCGLLLILIFRSIPYGLITLTVGFAGVAAEIAFLTLMRWPIDVVTSLVSALVIAIGTNFGILFTYRYIQETEQGEMLPLEAIRNTMKNLGRANVVAALSTVAGFLIIMLSQIVPLRRFGGVTAVGIAISLVASLTIMPALLYRMSAHKAEHEEPQVQEAGPNPATG